jgi:S-adenosylmethionine:tRNA ribosyltransferase-isomerase
VRVSDFDFPLPPELIAQSPLAERDGARMLTVDRQTGALADLTFRDLPSLLQPGDLLVLNDSRVVPARLFGRRAGLRTQANSPAPSGAVEVLLTQPLGDNTWRALVKPGRKVIVGERLLFGDGDMQLAAEAIAAGDFGERTLRFDPVEDFYAALDRLGHIPLPPYIHRSTDSDEQEDRERYQTVYAGERGSAAAPTAGLHFTPAVLDSIRERGVEIAYVTLHVGLGTFQPVRVEHLSEIMLHEEHYTISTATADALNRARNEGRRIVAAGTTTTRTLEHCAAEAGSQPVLAHSGSTSIFLQPGHSFRLVDALLTNFHLPQSTLLMLVSAFAGREHVLHAYDHAIQQRYRFFSYGDCMFLS